MLKQQTLTHQPNSSNEYITLSSTRRDPHTKSATVNYKSPLQKQAPIVVQKVLYIYNLFAIVMVCQGIFKVFMLNAIETLQESSEPFYCGQTPRKGSVN